MSKLNSDQLIEIVAAAKCLSDAIKKVQDTSVQMELNYYLTKILEAVNKKEEKE